MNPGPRRSRVFTVALLLSLGCHVAMLIWLALTPGAVFEPRTLEVVLVAKSDESRIAAPEESPSQARAAPPAESPAPPAETARAQPAPLARTAPAEQPIAAVTAEPRDSDSAPKPESQPVVAQAAGPALTSPTESAQETVTAGLRLAIRRRLAEFLNYPPAARRRAIEGDPVVRFVINRDGALLDYELARSSGSRHLDRAALQLVRDAAPYPVFPASLDLAQLEVQLPIEYRLTRLPRT